jgi:protein O-mannosyl-transferase
MTGFFRKYVARIGKRAGSSGVLSIVLFLLLLTVFVQVLDFEFVNFDDPIYVVENDQIQQGLTLETVKWAFTTNLHGHYHPLTWLSHALDFQLFGLQPYGHHLVNLLLHCSNTLLLFLLLYRSTGALWPSFFAAAIFGVHPLHVESVAWVADRKDLLCGLFWMISLLLYQRWVMERKFRLLLALLLVYCMGVLSKSMMLTLPMVLLLLDFWPLKRMEKVSVAGFFKIAVGEKLPFIFLAVIFVILTQKAMQELVVESKTLSPLWQYDFILFYQHYLLKFLVPLDLTVFYPYSETAAVRQLLVGGMVLVGITLSAILLRRQKSFALIGWLWFLITLLPVAGLIHDGPHRVADRYTYIPIAGLIIALCWIVFSAARSKRSAQAAFLLGGAVIAVLATMSFQQTTYWRDSESLFRHAAALYPENHLARHNLGDALERKGRIDEAMAQYYLAIRIRPGFARAHYNLGNIFASQGREEEALYHYTRAAENFPRFFEALHNAGVLLAESGRLLMAESYFRRALDLRPEFREAQENMAHLQQFLEPIKQEIRGMQRRLALSPDDAMALNELGLLYRRGGDIDAARHYLQQAIETDPKFAGAYNNLGILYAEQRNFSAAKQQFRKALEIDPLFHGARENILRIEQLEAQK